MTKKYLTIASLRARIGVFVLGVLLIWPQLIFGSYILTLLSDTNNELSCFIGTVILNLIWIALLLIILSLLLMPFSEDFDDEPKKKKRRKKK